MMSLVASRGLHAKLLLQAEMVDGLRRLDVVLTPEDLAELMAGYATHLLLEVLESSFVVAELLEKSWELCVLGWTVTMVLSPYRPCEPTSNHPV
jgi:hypothetical protein